MMANRLISRSTGIKLHDYGCTLKAYHFDVVKGVQLYGELHRFIPALASQMGVRVAEVPVKDRARRWGSSKYGFSRTFKVILDLIVVVFVLSYFNRPLYVFGAAGFLVGGIGGAAGRLSDRLQAADREQDRRSAAAAIGGPADGAGRAIYQHRHRRRYDHAHLPRIAAQAHLLHPRAPA